ncbi:beta-glucosidase BglX [Flavobacterium cucumis]|uniref:beta-glucosidase BglX n=1 Tax=Flavobacterium cucumis TaxID=416016 RepID=UPI000937BB89|nr:beta-glucosidase BglX [Flavobacterium cucumis]
MKKKPIYYSLILLLLLSFACNAPKRVMASKEFDSIDQKVDSVMQLMTLEEKIGQLNQYNGFWDVTGPAPKEGQAAKKYEDLKNGLVGSMLNVKGVKDVYALQKIAVEQTRLGIPLLFGFDVVHGYKTISPIPLAEAASWDLEAIKKSAAIAAEESAAVGINWTFAPMVDISRDARWGRSMEGAGEDPYLGSLIAIARIEGFQGDLSSNKSILACAKHFAGYGFAESGRDYNTVFVSDEILHNVILPPFKASVAAGVKTFMNSFNDLNGIPATGSAFLQRDLLKEDWKFDGFVVSDWGSINEMIPHGYAKDSKQAAEIAINAGSDMDMESYAYVAHLRTLVEEGKVAVAHIDDAARRILRTKFELGLFENPYKYCDEAYEKATVGKPDFHEGVLDMAKKSIVLLKNESHLLPLKKSGQKIALIGALANDKTSPLGSWRIAADDNTAVSVLEGMQKYPNNELLYAKGADVAVGRTQFMWETKINMTDTSGFAEAIETAKKADVVVMVLGEHGLQSGEGRSRADLGLPGVQQQLLEAVAEVNPNIVLVLTNGRPLAIPWAAENIPAIVEAWHLGTQSGNAIAQVLYGDYNPSGKLPMTFPRNIGQVPIYYNHKNTGRPVMNEPESVFWSHYIDEKNTPLYAFGHGLSYSKFEYTDLKLSSTTFSKNGSIQVSVTLKNNSNVPGKEVVQLYIRDLVGSYIRPVKELKGFELVSLAANETKTITFTIDESTLAFYTANNRWEAEEGEFTVFVGGSSDQNLTSNFQYTNN